MPSRAVVLVLLWLFAEIAGFIVVGQWIGILATLGLVLLGMVTGFALLRRQGIATMQQVRAEIAARRQPGRPLVDGTLLALAALLLILPGFVSDIAAFLLFIPALRRAVWLTVSRRAGREAQRRGMHRAAPGTIVELDRRDYALTNRADSPWRRKPNDPL